MGMLEEAEKQEKLIEATKKKPTPPSGPERSILQNMGIGLLRGVPETVGGLVDLGISGAELVRGRESGLPPATSFFENAGLPKSNNSFVERIFAAASGDLPFGISSAFTRAGIGLAARAADVARETTIAGASGLGGEIGKRSEIPGGELGGALIGGVTGASGIGAVTSAAEAASRIHPTFRGPVVKQQLAQTLGGQLASQDIAKVAKANQLNQDLGIELRNPDFIKGLQLPATAMVRRSPQRLADEQARVARIQEKLTQRASDLGPQGERLGLDDAAQFARRQQDAAEDLAIGVEERVQRRLIRDQESFNARAGQLQDNLNAQVERIVERFPDKPTRRTAGIRTINVLKKTQGQLESVFDEQYGKLNFKLPVKTETLHQGVETYRETAARIGLDFPSEAQRQAAAKKGRRLKPQFSNDLWPARAMRTLEELPNEVPLKELRAIRTQLLHEQFAEARKTAPSAMRLANIAKVRDSVTTSIHNNLEQLRQGGNDPDMIDDLLAADKDYAAFMDRFDRGQVGKVLRTEGTGTPFTPEQISTQLLKTRSDIEALQRAIGPEETQGIVEEAVFAKLLRFKPGSDTLDVGAMGTAMKNQDLQDVLEMFPSIKTEAIDLLQTAQRATKAKFTGPVSASIRKRIKEGVKQARQRTLPETDLEAFSALAGDRPERGIKLLLNSKNPEGFRVLRLAMKNDKHAYRGLLRATWDELLKEGGVHLKDVNPASINVDKLGAMLENNADILKEVYGEDAYKGLKLIHEAADFAKGAISDVAIDFDVPKSEFKKLVTTIASRAFAIQRRVIGLPFAVTERSGRLLANWLDKFDDKTSREVLENLLYSPDLLESLGEFAKGRQVLEFKRDIKRWVEVNVRPIAIAAVQTQRREPTESTDQ